MADSLLGQLSALATPEVMGQISKMTGVDTTSLSKGLGATGAATLGSMANTASTGDGLSSLMDMVNKAGGSGSAAGGASTGGATDAVSGALGSLLGGGDTNALLGSLMGSLGGGKGASAAGGITNSVMGSGINAISGTLSKALGFNVKPMLTMVAPVLLGMITKAVKSGGLDANGLKSMLTDQSKAFADDPANAETAKLVTAALDAGKKGAAIEAKYTPAGWNVIKSAPLAAVAMVAAASPSKGGGAEAEVSAASEAISQAAGQADPASLLNIAFGGDEITADEVAAVTDDPVKLIKAGVEQVTQGDADDLAAYKAMILSAANATAQATKEGGFLGIGGKQVSTQEQAVLDQLTSLLK
jgi:hypothetical protein